jgi:hypothetical protein
MAGDKSGGIQLAQFGKIGALQSGGAAFVKHVHQCTKRVSFTPHFVSFCSYRGTPRAACRQPYLVTDV